VRNRAVSLVVVSLVSLASLAAPAAAAEQATLGGVRVALRPDTRQVVTVNHTRGFHARVGFWVHRQGRWTQVYGVRDGRIGYGGLVAATKRVQGSGTTPLGTVRLTSAFGRHPRGAGWDLTYRRIHRGDFWVEDNRSPFYNRYRNRAQGGFRWWIPATDANSSERLTDFPQQYEFSIVTSYNREQVRHRGAGIFLHVNGSGVTAGCVSAPRPFLRRMMWRLDPAQAPVLAVGR
jgi:L,D-peptidoglycan transpeptidase YkuD (ErfK/YbiS/YcfS/YnhG family)